VLRCPSNRIFVSGAAGPTNSLMEHTSSALDPLSAYDRGDGRPPVAASRTDADRGLDLFLGAIVDSGTGGCRDLEVGAGVSASSMWFVRHRVAIGDADSERATHGGLTLTVSFSLRRVADRFAPISSRGDRAHPGLTP